MGFAPIIHAAIVIALLAAYVILRVSGADEPILLGIIAGQLSGAAVQATTGKPPQV